MRYERYRDSAGQWRWRLRAANREIIAVSSEGYVNKADCSHAITLTKSSSDAPVYDVDQ